MKTERRLVRKTERPNTLLSLFFGAEKRVKEEFAEFFSWLGFARYCDDKQISPVGA